MTWPNFGESFQSITNRPYLVSDPGMLEEEVDESCSGDDGRQRQLEREDVQEEGDRDPEVDVEVPVAHFVPLPRSGVELSSA